MNTTNPTLPVSKTVQTIRPPEAVPIHFERASIGARFLAQMLDILITYGSFALLIAFFAWAFGLFSYGLVTFFILGSFFLRSPYYIVSELVWNGQTLGKKALGITVISANGKSLMPYQIVARNLMKEVDFFFPLSVIFGLASLPGWLRIFMLLWIGFVILVPIVSKRNQRLGDMIAGTLVVDKPKSILMPDLVNQSLSVENFKFTFEPAQLDAYGLYELQTLESILREGRPRTKIQTERIESIARAIHRKIKYPNPIPREQSFDFLQDFYAQERRYLEERNLFGDRRENKFHHKTAS